MTYKKALEFAATKHAGQKRRNGDNYIIHPIRVSQEVFTTDQKIIALLHDTFEDTDTTYEELVDQFGENIADAVVILTHGEGVPYENYIRSIRNSGNTDAIQVKIADIADNLGDSPTNSAIIKGANAISILTEK